MASVEAHDDECADMFGETDVYLITLFKSNCADDACRQQMPPVLWWLREDADATATMRREASALQQHTERMDFETTAMLDSPMPARLDNVSFWTVVALENYENAELMARAAHLVDAYRRLEIMQREYRDLQLDIVNAKADAKAKAKALSI